MYYSGEKFFVKGWDEFGNGKVIGEFVCDKIGKIDYCIQTPDNATSGQDCYWGYDYDFVSLDEHCLTKDEIYAHGSKKPLYSWHISDLVIYDKPKELGDFKPFNRECKYSDLGFAIPKCDECHSCKVERPPRSWCYVVTK